MVRLDETHDTTPWPPPGALLVRVPVEPASRLLRLPRVPEGHTVTVTVNLTDPNALPAATLAHLGYRIVDRFANVRSLNEPCADLLVMPETRADGDWLTELTMMAERVFALDLGPVRKVFAEELAVHRLAPVS